MSSAKCTSCNVVISEILAFIQNKLQVIDQISLIQICSSAFTAEDIVAAKNLLFDCVKSTKKKSQRKRDGKSQRDLEDIIGLFRELDPDDFPVFVVKDINKLPPVTFDHVDVTKLLKDILLLQKEITGVKQNYALKEELDALKCDVENIKTASIVNNFDMTNVNTLRGSSKLNILDTRYDSGPIGLLHIPEPVYNPIGAKILAEPRLSKPSSTKTSPTPANLRMTTDRSKGTSRRGSVSSPKAGIEPTSAPEPVHMPTYRKSFAQLASEEGDWRDRQPTEEWKTVQRKRYRNRLETTKGEAKTEPEMKFRAADIKVPLFINNVDKCTSAHDISSYILQKTTVEVSLEKIKSKMEREYDSYKIIVPRSKLPMFMDAKLWPDGISFRRFVSFYKRDGAVSSDLTK